MSEETTLSSSIIMMRAFILKRLEQDEAEDEDTGLSKGERSEPLAVCTLRITLCESYLLGDGCT